MRKNRRINGLFIGTEFLNKEGRSVKHPALIQYNANLRPNKSKDTMIELIGVDIETDYKTGQMSLLGFYEGNSDDYGLYINNEGNEVQAYRHYRNDFFNNLVATITYAMSEQKHLAYWSELDASQILKEFIKADYSEYVYNDVLERYKKVSGEYDPRLNEWEVRPVIAVDTGLFIIGIKQAIRGSLQFFIQRRGQEKIKTCWGYNIKSLYMRHLEAEADKSEGGRFEWYSKIGDEAHLLSKPEWEKFDNNLEFRTKVLLSNELDAKAAMALGYEIQKDFNEAFKYTDDNGDVLDSYPNSLISQGSHARSAVAIDIRNTLLKDSGMSVKEFQDKKSEEARELKKRISAELKSIPLITHLDYWLGIYEEPLVHDLYAMTSEAYSGGYIEAISYGSAKEGWTADIASAYPAVIQDLYDLRGSTLEEGTGKPPEIKNAYIFVRGLVFIPKGTNFHSVTIKHASTKLKDVNVRYEGYFYATYTDEERDFVESIGGKFAEEKWIAVITKGKLSVLSKVSKKLGRLRDHFLSIGSRTEALVKRINNSGYGILFEAVDIHEEIDGKPKRVGYRAGEFFNPLYATIITSRTRIRMAQACIDIEKAGGQVCIIMTDSVTWVGQKSDLPKLKKFKWGESGIKTKKTFGYFEEPENVKNLIVLGAGLYGYDIIEKDVVTKKINKRRGFNVSALLDADGEEILDINGKPVKLSWSLILDLMKKKGSDILDVKVRRLLSVGILNHQREKYCIDDLGKIVDEIKHISAISGKGKRVLQPYMFDPEGLSNNMYKTTALYAEYGMVGGGYIDGTLPLLRAEMSKYKMESVVVRKRDKSRKRQAKFYTKNKVNKNEVRRNKYNLAKEKGFNSYDCTKIQNWNMDKLIAFLDSGKTLEEFINYKEVSKDE